MSIGSDFRPARKIQRDIQDVDPHTKQYADMLHLFDAVQNSARRANPGYIDCIHGPNKNCGEVVILVCDGCIETERLRED